METAILCSFFIGYLVGYYYGIMSNIKSNIDHAVNKLPVNVKVQKVDNQYIAYLLHNDSFVCQSNNVNDLVKLLEVKFPNRIIVIKDEVNELL